ncbi:hypothetical protein HOD88_02015 [archaeon]|mgnify:FL=1|jgi:hypothetical protein|nr:hypothetical protein [archaeon]
MKKSVLVLSLLLVFVFQFVLAEDNMTESQKISEGYSCLTNQISEEGCDSLTTEEKIFSLLAVSNCQSELMDDSSNDECWPKGDCNIKNTAQAILALDGSDDAEDWLYTKNKTTSDMKWYLEIDSNEETTCTISYAGSSPSIIIGEDKKLSSSAGACLSLDPNGYWLEVLPSCYGNEFEVSCDKGFVSAFLFKKDNSDTIHVTKESKVGSAEGSVTMQVQSSCFGAGTGCDYEGTLWAAIVLDYFGEDVSNYLPYIITLADENEEYLPESFIYSLTDYEDSKTSLLLKQKAGYWDESGNKLYDTAVALYPFQYSTPVEKESAKEWLFNLQDEEGCFGGNTRDTAFVLHSLFPRTFAGGDSSKEDCEEAGYDCLTRASCTGTELTQYDCSAGLSICCSEPKEEKTCSELAGEICSTNQICQGGIEEDASNTQIGEVCCVTGTCEEKPEPGEDDFTCEINDGSCELNSCEEGYEEDSYYTCEYSTDLCCMPKSEDKKGSSIWIWILLVLIVLVVIGIYFKDKLAVYWAQISSKFKKGGPSKPNSFKGRPQGFPPTRIPSRQPRPPMQGRKILPRPTGAAPARPTSPPIQKRPMKKPSGDMDEVLRKLKEMGK